MYIDPNHGVYQGGFIATGLESGSVGSLNILNHATRRSMNIGLSRVGSL
jgi:hypothetical protein